MSVIRLCIKCREWKREEEFYPSCLKTYDYYCIKCWRAKVGDYKRRHREKVAKIERDYYHRIQNETGCHMRLRDFYPAYRMLRALESANVVEI